MLYPTQQEVLNEANKNQIYELGTGSGKTFIGLHHYLKHGQDSKLLIIAPPTKVKEGGWQKSIKVLEKQYDTTIDYEIISWAVLFKRKEEFDGYFILVDECHTCKNSTSQVGKGLYRVCKFSEGFCLLSATPMSNGWEDSINYFKIFNLTQNKTQFMNRYALKEMIKRRDGKSFPKITGWRSEGRLKEMWNKISIQRSADYFVELPDLNEVFIEFNKSSIYKAIDKDRVIEQDGELIAFDNQAKLNAARRKYGNRKEKMKHLEMLLDTDENVLIFYNFNLERDDIYEVINKTNKKIYEVSGHKNEIPDESIWPELKNAVTLVQYQAGGAGIELQYCSIVVIYAPTYSYQDHTQAIGRAYRPSEHKKIVMYKYKVKGTIEDAVYDSLENKKDFKESLYEG